MMFSKAACVTIALFLVLTTAAEAMAIQRSATELRCQCISLESKQLARKIMSHVELIPSGPHCKNVEVIITLKNGNQVCVDPSAPWVERIIKSILERQQNGTETV